MYKNYVLKKIADFQKANLPAYLIFSAQNTDRTNNTMNRQRTKYKQQGRKKDKRIQGIKLLCYISGVGNKILSVIDGPEL